MANLLARCMPKSTEPTMNPLPERLEEREGSSGNHRAAEASRQSSAPPGRVGHGSLADARGGLAEALRGGSAAGPPTSALHASLAARRTPSRGDPGDLGNV